MSSVATPRPTLLEVRDRMRARNDAHARAEGHGGPAQPLPLRELAPAIALSNQARVDREMLSAARSEILQASEGVAREVARMRAEPTDLPNFLDTVESFHFAIAEYLRANAAQSSPARSSALVAMREAIASLDRVRGGR